MTIAITIVLILIDQLSKYYASQVLANQDLKIIENFLRLTYLENRGAAFGILQDRQILFFIITLIVVGGIIYFLPKTQRFSWTYWSFVLILAGSLGNFIDRLRLGYVVDFISFKFGSYHFAIFNLADTFIVLGSIILCLDILFHDSGKKSLND